MQTVRAWGIMVIFLQCFYQTAAIIKPKTPQQYYISLAYMAISIISLTLFCLSFFNNKHYNLIFYAIMITQFRTLFRLLDLEKTKTLSGNEHWQQMVYAHSVGCAFNTVLIHHNFNFPKLKKILVNMVNCYMLLSFMFISSLDNLNEKITVAFIDINV